MPWTEEELTAIQDAEEVLTELCKRYHTTRDKLVDCVKKQLKRSEDLEKEIDRLKQQLNGLDATKNSV